MQNLPAHLIEAIKDNLFPASHAAICDWNKFRWHRNNKGNIQTHKPNSSQALAIEVFGTIKASDERDRILGDLARICGLPDQGPWTIELEWIDPGALLGEPTPTQVDAIAFGKHALLVFECKFTESGGGCSQPNLIREGAHKGLRQCNGHYAMQINPVNAKEARCALTGKGVRYWEAIPEIFGLDAEKDHRPCPFRCDAYQWMRNVVLADRLASDRRVSSAVIGAYAEADGFPTAEEVRRSGRLGHPAASGKTLVTPMSYQSMVSLAQSLSTQPAFWRELEAWVERKIATANGREASRRALP
jgi:hypothetical protein